MCLCLGRCLCCVLTVYRAVLFVSLYLCVCVTHTGHGLSATHRCAAAGRPVSRCSDEASKPAESGVVLQDLIDLFLFLF